MIKKKEVKMAIKVKKKNGKVVEYPADKIRRLLSTIGFTGGLLVRGTMEVFKEAKKLTTSGIISATNFEKAIVKAVNNTNKIAINTTQKVTRRVLK